MIPLANSRPTRLANHPAEPAQRNESAEDLKAAAAQFEAIFARMMIGSMRQASLAEDMLANAAAKTFRDHHDGQIAESLGAKGALGLGKALADYLTRRRPEYRRDEGASRS
jgi:flagellar protein FlgJ